jgi:hypothetical protein
MEQHYYSDIETSRMIAPSNVGVYRGLKEAGSTLWMPVPEFN